MSASSVALWMTILTIGICSIILSAASEMPELYMAATALISIAIAAIGIRQLRALDDAGASASAISAETARYMGMVWAFGALSLLATYYFILPAWREWPVFFAAFAIIAVLCLLFATALANDADKAAEDPTLLKLGRYLTIAQFAGTLIAIAGLMIDPDKFFLNTAKKEWAANNVFLFGAIALAAISASALFYTRDRSKAA